LNKEILTPEIQDFIFKSIHLDPTAVSLGKSQFPQVSSRELAEQLSGRKKARTKLPFWFKTRGIYYPPSLNLEQASSELTGRYKAALATGSSLLDLTGGAGIDTYLMREGFQKVDYVERNAQLAEIAAHNFGVLGAENIRIHTGDALEMIASGGMGDSHWDWIYLDPSRRKKDRSRVFLLEDCEPPLPEILPRLFEVSSNIMIKTSPMMDITEGIRILGNVREVHVVAVGNEVRELIWRLQKGFDQEAERLAADLTSNLPPLRFTALEEAEAPVEYCTPLSYLYEPNAALLKAGGFKIAAARYGLQKIHPSTHLYTSDTSIDFPGRRFKVIRDLDYKPGKLPFNKANVSTRNFPESVAVVRKRNRIRDGGDTYLFFIRSLDESLRVLACQRL
jgi:hypothetical protein